jgi:hypothetical protein
MAVRPFRRPGRAWASASVALLVLGAAAGVAAQAQRGLAPLTVSVTVVRPCSIETPGAPTDQAAAGREAPELVKIRCGRATSTYSLPPGAGATSTLATPSRPVVTRASDGKTVTIQF